MRKNIKKISIQTEISVNWKILVIFLVSFVVTYFVVLGAFQLVRQKTKTKNQSKQTLNNTIKNIFLKITKPKYNYYESKKPTIDPVMVKELIDSTEKDYVIVDIRSSMEYKWNHMKGAINMPAYENPNNVYQTQTKLDDVYKKVSKKFAGKKLVIVYSYRPESDMTDKVFEYFKKYKYPVRVLSITWYDWLHNFASWMPGIQAGGFDNSKYIEGNNNLSQPVQPVVPGVPIAPGIPIIPQ